MYTVLQFNLLAFFPCFCYISRLKWCKSMYRHCFHSQNSDSCKMIVRISTRTTWLSICHRRENRYHISGKKVGLHNPISYCYCSLILILDIICFLMDVDVKKRFEVYGPGCSGISFINYAPNFFKSSHLKSWKM